MTVRTWFRLLRRSAWESDHLPEVTLYCRAVHEPLGPGVKLYALTDYQRIIDHPEFAEPVVQLVQRDIRKYISQLLL